MVRKHVCEGTQNPSAHKAICSMSNRARTTCDIRTCYYVVLTCSSQNEASCDEAKIVSTTLGACMTSVLIHSSCNLKARSLNFAASCSGALTTSRAIRWQRWPWQRWGSHVIENSDFVRIALQMGRNGNRSEGSSVLCKGRVAALALNLFLFVKLKK